MKALILVDLQNDFFPNGKFAVHDADRILPQINALLNENWDLIVATKDWHPSNHCSFVTNHKGKQVGDKVIVEGIEQILWPVHCVQNSEGAEFKVGWNTQKVDEIIYKGADTRYDSYSTFFDNKHILSTGLHDLLQRRKIDEIWIAGLASDYCVKYSVLDGLDLGYRVYVVKNACLPVNLLPDDETKAFEEMKCAGAVLLEINLLLKKPSFS